MRSLEEGQRLKRLFLVSSAESPHPQHPFWIPAQLVRGVRESRVPKDSEEAEHEEHRVQRKVSLTRVLSGTRVAIDQCYHFLLKTVVKSHLLIEAWTWAWSWVWSPQFVLFVDCGLFIISYDQSHGGIVYEKTYTTSSFYNFVLKLTRFVED